MTCINLQQHFGDRFKVTHEESYSHEKVDRPSEESWLQIIPCKNGLIYPASDSKLAAYCDRKIIRKQLAELPCCEVTQWGDYESTVTFPPEDFDQIAEVMKPKKRRRLTKMNRDKLMAAGVANRFISSKEHFTG